MGFKVVLAKGISGVQVLTDDVLSSMEAFSSIAPAHNPPYLAAIRQFRALLPGYAAHRRVRNGVPPHHAAGGVLLFHSDRDFP